MTDIPALRIHAVMLGVRNVDASVAFYTGKLGFTQTARFGDFAFLDCGGSALVLSADLVRARPGTGPEAVEMVLAVDGVRTAYAALRARGVNFVNEPRSVDGTNEAANFEDLDGHLFSLYGKP